MASASSETHCVILACRSPVEMMTRAEVDGESSCPNTDIPSSGVMPNSAKVLLTERSSGSLKRQKSQSILIQGTELIWHIRCANVSTSALVAVTEKRPK